MPAELARQFNDELGDELKALGFDVPGSRPSPATASRLPTAAQASREKPDPLRARITAARGRLETTSESSRGSSPRPTKIGPGCGPPSSRRPSRRPGFSGSSMRPSAGCDSSRTREAGGSRARFVLPARRSGSCRYGGLLPLGVESDRGRTRARQRTRWRQRMPRAISRSWPMVGERRSRAPIERRDSHAASGKDRSAFSIRFTARRLSPLSSSPHRSSRISAWSRAGQALWK